MEGAVAEKPDGQTGDSLEKALSRGPGLLGAAAAGTAVHVAVAVAGTVSGSTTLRESQGTGERGPRPRPHPPPGPLTSSPRCDSPPRRPHPHRPALRKDTGSAQPGPGPASLPTAPGAQTHPHSHSWPHCWLQREGERETESGEMGHILRQPGPRPGGPAPLTAIGVLPSRRHSVGAPWGLWGSPESQKSEVMPGTGLWGKRGCNGERSPQSKEVRGREGEGVTYGMGSRSGWLKGGQEVTVACGQGASVAEDTGPS